MNTVTELLNEAELSRQIVGQLRERLPAGWSLAVERDVRVADRGADMVLTLTGPDENSYSPLGTTSTSDPVYTVGLSSAEVSGQNHQGLFRCRQRDGGDRQQQQQQKQTKQQSHHLPLPVFHGSFAYNPQHCLI